MSEPTDVSPAEEFVALAEGSEAPPAPTPPAWAIIGALVLSGLALVVGVVLTWPASTEQPATQLPTPPRPPIAAPPSLAEVTVAPSVCSGDACTVQADHPDWPLAVCAAVAEKRVALGMTAAQVQAAWGEPARTDADKQCYDDGCARWVRIVDDRVVESEGG